MCVKNFQRGMVLLAAAALLQGCNPDATRTGTIDDVSVEENDQFTPEKLKVGDKVTLYKHNTNEKLGVFCVKAVGEKSVTLGPC